MSFALTSQQSTLSPQRFPDELVPADARDLELDLTSGSLDHPEDFPPNRDVFPEEKLSWVGLVSEKTSS